MNNTILGGVQSDLKYYSIRPASNGLAFNIYQYSTLNDKLNQTNGIAQAVNNLTLANQELATGIWFSDRIKLWTEIFETHSNDPNYPQTNTLYTSNEIVIPITVDTMQVQAYHFNSRYGFHNKQNSSVNFTLLDLKNRIIPLGNGIPNVPILTLRYEEAEHGQ